MQIGVAHLVTFFIGMALLIGGAFAAGTQWRGENRVETAAVVSALEKPASSSEEILAPEGSPAYKVLRVVDGDTIVIERDGKSESVRLIGVDTPELNDSRVGVQCFAKEASEKTTSLVTGKNVWLEVDPSQGERDKYKRLLAYVFVEDGTFVNLALIKGGYAHEYTYDGTYKYQAEFKAAHVEAKESEVGLWSPDMCPTTPMVRASNSTQKGPPANQAAVAPPAAQPVQEPVQQPLDSSRAITAQPAPQQEPQSDPTPTPVPAQGPTPQSEPSNASIVCSSNTYNCSDFKTQKEAQKVYDQCGGVGNDVHRLDNNKDGSACDSLP